MILSQELSNFIEAGVAIIVAARDRHFVPDSTRGVGIIVGDQRDTLTIYVQLEGAQRILPLLQESPQMALAIARPTDYKAVIFK